MIDLKDPNVIIYGNKKVVTILPSPILSFLSRREVCGLRQVQI